MTENERYTKALETFAEDSKDLREFLDEQIANMREGKKLDADLAMVLALQGLNAMRGEILELRHKVLKLGTGSVRDGGSTGIRTGRQPGSSAN